MQFSPTKKSFIHHTQRDFKNLAKASHVKNVTLLKISVALLHMRNLRFVKTLPSMIGLIA